MDTKLFKEIKINRINPNGINPVHVNDMVASHDGKEVFVQFFEVEPPALLDSEELSKLETIEAIMKVKLVISPEFLEAMVNALKDIQEKVKIARKVKNE